MILAWIRKVRIRKKTDLFYTIYFYLQNKFDISKSKVDHLK